MRRRSIAAVITANVLMARAAAAEDAADAAFVQAGAGRDVRQGEPLALEAQQFAVGGRTELEEVPPQLFGLSRLARLRLALFGQDVEGGAGRLLAL